MPYSLGSKTGVMLSSRDVRASVPKYMVSVPKYMVTVPKYLFRDTSHYQLQLFVERACHWNFGPEKVGPTLKILVPYIS